jgi:hypothetical protein
MTMTHFDPAGPGLERIGAATHAEEVVSKMSAGGYSQRRRDLSPARRRRVTEAARLFNDGMSGRIDPFLFKQAFQPTSELYVNWLRENYPGVFGGAYRDKIGLRETMSYSDYSALTTDILDRALYDYYTAAPITNLPLAKKVTLRDFRLVARYAMDGAVSPWSQVGTPTGTAPAFPTVPHGAGEPPTQRAMAQAAREVLGSTQRVTYQPQMYQGGMSVNWRALVNDDLGIFRDMTNRLAIGGRRTIYQYITSLYVDSNGPHATLYSSTFANQITIANGAVTNNPAFSLPALMDAMTVLGRMLDIDGQPITFDGTLYIWFGPSIATTVQNVLKSTQADISTLGGTTNTQGFPSQRLRIENWAARGIVPIEDKYIRLTCTTAGTKETMWGLMYDPNTQARPALELGFLTGFDTPQLFQKVPNTMRVGGGVDPMLGDFYSMDQEFKGVLVMGGTQIDGRSTVASTGQGV